MDRPEALLVGSAGGRVRLPESVRRLLARAVHELARGNAVSIVPIQAGLTTQQAADLEIPFHHVGSHRRVRFEDLMAYRQRRSQARRQALAKMAREAQEMGLYE